MTGVTRLGLTHRGQEATGVTRSGLAHREEHKKTTGKTLQALRALDSPMRGTQKDYRQDFTGVTRIGLAHREEHKKTFLKKLQSVSLSAKRHLPHHYLFSFLPFRLILLLCFSAGFLGGGDFQGMAHVQRQGLSAPVHTLWVRRPQPDSVLQIIHL